MKSKRAKRDTFTVTPAPKFDDPEDMQRWVNASDEIQRKLESLNETFEVPEDGAQAFLSSRTSDDWRNRGFRHASVKDFLSKDDGL